MSYINSQFTDTDIPTHTHTHNPLQQNIYICRIHVHSIITYYRDQVAYRVFDIDVCPSVNQQLDQREVFFLTGCTEGSFAKL